MNPELAMTLPPYQIACGATDILAHIMERYFTCETEVDLTDRLCEGAMQAVIGITEATDAVSLIVSEETGIISMAREGKLTRYLDAKSLTILLTEIFNPSRKKSGSLMESVTGRLESLSSKYAPRREKEDKKDEE